MNKIKIPQLCKSARLLLRIQMHVILLFTVAFAVSYLQARALDPVLANSVYPTLMEYIFAAFLITECSVIIVQASELDRR